MIVDISDPRNPRRVGKFNCPGGQNDIQLSPDGRYLALAVETTSNKCHPGDEGTVDHRRLRPRPRRSRSPGSARTSWSTGRTTTRSTGRTCTSTSTRTRTRSSRSSTCRTRRSPKKIGGIDYGGQDSHHDLIVDHRPDGKSFAYAASINFSDVIDVTDPTKPVLRERIRDPQVSISHQAEPNHDRSLLLVTDEFGGGAAGPGCGGNPAATVPGSEAIPPAGHATRRRSARCTCTSSTPDGDARGRERAARRPASSTSRTSRRTTRARAARSTCSGRRPTRTA